MDAKNTGYAGFYRLIDGRNAALDDREVVADKCRQQTGGAEASMRGRNRRDGLHRRIVVEQPSAATIHLHIDESRQQQLTVEVDQLRFGRRRVGDSADVLSVDHDTAIVADAL